MSPKVGDAELNALFAASWPDHGWVDFSRQLRHSLVYVCAYVDGRLAGFVNLAWDGGIHSFLLDPTVHPDWQRRGIGRGLVERAVQVARDRGLEWVHVDFDPPLRPFYAAYGFAPTEAGLIHLAPAPVPLTRWRYHSQFRRWSHGRV